MSDTEMLILEKNGDGANITDYYSYTYEVPTTVLPLNISLISYTVNSSGIFGTFSRPLVNYDSLAENLQNGTVTPIGWAYLYKDEGFVKHNQIGEGTMVFGDTQEDSKFIPKMSSTTKNLDYLQDHGTYMTIMWVGVIELAIISIRYFKWWFWSGVIHGLLGSLAIAFTLGSCLHTYNKDKIPFFYDEGRFDRAVHSRMGLTVTALTTLQALLGLYARYLINLKNNSKVTSLIRKVHQTIGLSVLFIALFNIKYGWVLHKKDYNLDSYVYPAYIVLVLLILILEIRHRFAYLYKNVLPDDTVVKIRELELYELIQKEKTHVEIIKKIKKDQKAWVFYDEFVLDLSGYRWNHPGGSYFFPQIYGQDVGKYLCGSSGIDDNVTPHIHSKKALNMIPYLAISKVAYPSDVLLNIEPLEKLDSMNWVLVDNVAISSSTHCLEFSSQLWKVNSSPSGYEWMGKHFLVTYKVNGFPVRRYYSLLVANLGVWADEAKSQGFGCREYSMSKSQENLRLHIKNFKGGLFSPIISNLNLGSIVNFKGPIGPGLCIDTFVAKDYLILGAGTGILPFLDLIYQVWLGNIKSGFFHVYMSFRVEEESFALDLVQATADKFPNQLKFYTRSSVSSFAQESEFWESIFPIKKAERAWICGPPIFNLKYQMKLIEYGLDSNRITLL